MVTDTPHLSCLLCTSFYNSDARLLSQHQSFKASPVIRDFKWPHAAYSFLLALTHISNHWESSELLTFPSPKIEFISTV